MEGLIVLNSSVHIELFRKKDKSKSFFYSLASQFNGYAISVIVHYKIMVGSTPGQKIFWKYLFDDFLILPYTPAVNYTAFALQKELKTKRKSFGFKDLLIASTAVHFNYPLGSFNKNHFQDTSLLHLLTP